LDSQDHKTKLISDIYEISAEVIKVTFNKTISTSLCIYLISVEIVKDLLKELKIDKKMTIKIFILHRSTTNNKLNVKLY